MINILHTNEIERNIRNKIIHSLIVDEYVNAYLPNIPIIERMGTACYYFNKVQGKKLLPEYYTLSLGTVIVVPRGEKIMEKCNELVLDKSLWESDLDFREDFGVIIETLLKHNYPVVLNQEIPGHISIRYNGKEEWGCSQPVWLTEDEKLSVQWEDE